MTCSKIDVCQVMLTAFCQKPSTTCPWIIGVWPQVREKKKNNHKDQLSESRDRLAEWGCSKSWGTKGLCKLVHKGSVLIVGPLRSFQWGGGISLEGPAVGFFSFSPSRDVLK